MFFRKNKVKQEAVVQPAADVKPEVKPEAKTNPNLLPFDANPTCPKCDKDNGVTAPKYCKGKSLFRRCKHKVKGEHFHLSCDCGYDWAQACKSDGPNIKDVVKSYEDGWAAAATRKKTKHNPLEGLGFSEDFLQEVKELQASSSVKEIPPLPVTSDNSGNYRSLKAKEAFYNKVVPIQEAVPQDPPFLTEAKAKFTHDHWPLAGACAREQIVNVLCELARAVRLGEKESAINCISQATAYVNLL